MPACFQPRLLDASILGPLCLFQQILRQERSGGWSSSKFVQPYIAQLSPDAIDLLNRILHVDPAQRATLHDVAQHPWMRK